MYKPFSGMILQAHPQNQRFFVVLAPSLLQLAYLFFRVLEFLDEEPTSWDVMEGQGLKKKQGGFLP